MHVIDSNCPLQTLAGLYPEMANAVLAVHRELKLAQLECMFTPTLAVTAQERHLQVPDMN